MLLKCPSTLLRRGLLALVLTAGLGAAIMGLAAPPASAHGSHGNKDKGTQVSQPSDPGLHCDCGVDPHPCATDPSLPGCSGSGVFGPGGCDSGSDNPLVPSCSASGPSSSTFGIGCDGYGITSTGQVVGCINPPSTSSNPGVHCDSLIETSAGPKPVCPGSGSGTVSCDAIGPNGPVCPQPGPALGGVYCDSLVETSNGPQPVCPN